MKLKLYILSLISILLLQSSIILAGGSSAQINETNVRDKYLTAGKSDQLLMSFTVQSGGLTIEQLDITCSPSHGFTDLKLMDGDTEIAKTTFHGMEGTNQEAKFPSNDYLLPEGQTTELSLLVTVADNTGDFATACAIDTLKLHRVEDDWIFGSEAQAVNFSGIDRLIYVDDLNEKSSTIDTNIFDSKYKPSDLELDSTNNLLLDFNINAASDIKIQDIFFICERGSIIYDYRLEVNGVTHDASAMQNNNYTLSRAEHSWRDRVIFANINSLTGHGQGANFKLYGDTYAYFSNPKGTYVNCSVIDITTKEEISSLEKLKYVTEREQSLLKDINSSLTNRLLGKILLQVETHGQAWYLDPVSELKYYLPDGNIAYEALRNFGLGISNADLNKIPVGIEKRFVDTDSDNDGLADALEEGLKTDPNDSDSDNDGFLDGEEVLNGYNPIGTGKNSYDTNLANRLKGRILLQVESKGEAWYINPDDGKRYYLKNGEAAYQIMKYLSLGISNQDIRKIDVGTME